MTQTFEKSLCAKDRLDQEGNEIWQSGLFDSQYYLETYEDAASDNCDPMHHFLQYGAKEGRNPHPLFDSAYYLKIAGESAKVKSNPLLHFLREGHRQGFSPHPLFDLAYYRQQAKDLIGDDNPLSHFLKHGNRLKLNPNPYFDTKFYLSQYADIKKGSRNALVHFVLYGAREYRRPSKRFDPIYYFKTVPQAYAENALIHYLRIGQAWQIPIHAPKPASHSRISELIVRTGRLLIFVSLCLTYHFKRKNGESLIEYDHQCSGFKFFNLTIKRFWQGCGLGVKLGTASYLIQPKKLAQSESHQQRIFKAPLAFAYLYLANVLKVQGFCSDAEIILNRLIRDSRVRDLALCSLGDLLLVEAIWANEFKAYEEEGVLINPFPQRNKFTEMHTWHTRTFEDALAVMKEALAANDQNTDAQWLLGYTLLLAKKYSDALEVFATYPPRAAEIIERGLFEARVKYGLNQKDGIASLQELFNDENSVIADLELINAADVPPSVMEETYRVFEKTQMPIESRIIRNLGLTSYKNILEFSESHLSRFKKVEILPAHGIMVVDHKLLIKESSHMKLCHMPLFNSCIQEITDHSALLFTNKALLFEENNCVYIGYNNNYYHWLLDELPKLSLLETSNLFVDEPILIDKNAAAWQRDFLEMLGVEKNRLRQVDFKRPLSFKNLIVPSHLSRYMVAHPAAVGFMRKKLLPAAENLRPEKGKRLYISRHAQSSTGRSMLNERRITDKFKKNNFRIVDPSQLSVKEQIELFCDAEIIAGPAGAGLTNILFAPKEARILSLGASQSSETFTSLACAIGQEHWSIRGPSYPNPYPYWIWTTFDYEINEKDIDFCFNYIL